MKRFNKDQIKNQLMLKKFLTDLKQLKELGDSEEDKEKAKKMLEFYLEKNPQFLLYAVRELKKLDTKLDEMSINLTETH